KRWRGGGPALQELDGAVRPRDVAGVVAVVLRGAGGAAAEEGGVEGDAGIGRIPAVEAVARERGLSGAGEEVPLPLPGDLVPGGGEDRGQVRQARRQVVRIGWSGEDQVGVVER